MRDILLKKEVGERILILDGAMGTMIQRKGLSDADFTYQGIKCAGNNDILSLTRPDVIKSIHSAMLTAGADIIETNSFNTNAISQADYGLEKMVREMALASARIARETADEFAAKDGHPRFVAGSIGPTNRSLSMSPDINNPAFRNVTFDELVATYKTAAGALVEGGADILLIETIFDTLNAKAAIFAVKTLFEEIGHRVPVMISGTITDDSGRILSGQTVAAFLCSVAHAEPFSIGLNCSFGAEKMMPHLEELSKLSKFRVSAHPNAGLPNEFGHYDQTPEMMAKNVRKLADDGLINIVGGCCGTTPEHIKAIASAVKGMAPRKIPLITPATVLSGLEPLVINEDSLFVNIGERTNVAGSARFSKMIKEKRYEEALEVARKQVENGAQAIDINMDEAMLDSKKEMETFLNYIAAEPHISRVPVVIDSSSWDVLEMGLKHIQGKGVVNSISLKEGETAFIEKARLIRKYGAAAIVMAFDEKGQADTFARKKEVMERSHRILVEEAGFPPEDIIFDANIFAIGTGMDEHKNFAIDFIDAVRFVREQFAPSKTSGGVSNISFSFRGNDAIREAIHSVFLYHAISAGLNMGIVNAGQLAIYDDLPTELKTRVEDLVLNRRADATEKLLEIAGEFAGGKKAVKDDAAWRKNALDEKISYALTEGITKYLEEDLKEAVEKYADPVDIIEGPLMRGMNHVGELFGKGKMFLPQVVKSARVMKQAVSFLMPLIEAGKGRVASKGKVVIATVKGDVHDIGKNIVSVILRCNGFDVVDLGVMVPAEKIIEGAKREGADILGLSGLITPSLEEMRHVASLMEKEGMDIPLLIGGATTSRVHTAVKIATEYSGAVKHVKDASLAPGVAVKLVDKKQKGQFIKEIAAEHELERKKRDSRLGDIPLITLEEARQKRFVPHSFAPVKPANMGVTVLADYPLDELAKYIDWTFFFHAWEMRDTHSAEAKKIFDDAEQLLKELINGKKLKAAGVIGLFPANSTADDNIEIYKDDERKNILAALPTLRQERLKTNTDYYLSLSDYIAPKSSGINDYIGLFAVTAGLGLEKIVAEFEKNGDDYSAIMAKVLADRLAEAFAEKLHEQVRKELWGYARDENLKIDELLHSKYSGIRPAPGYPACPDHAEKEMICDILNAKKNIGMTLTESYMMVPAASVSGYYFSHPESKYFAIGKIGTDQVIDYAKRKGISEETARTRLISLLEY